MTLSLVVDDVGVLDRFARVCRRCQEHAFVCSMSLQCTSKLLDLGPTYRAFPSLRLDVNGVESQLVFLDAFVPQDGQSLFDTIPDHGAAMKKIAEESGDGWKVPLGRATFGMTDENDVAWMAPRITPQPLRSFEEPVRLTNQAALALPRSYILCRQDEPSLFDPFAKHAHSTGWGYYELMTCHDAMITMPEALATPVTCAV